MNRLLIKQKVRDHFKENHNIRVEEIVYFVHGHFNQLQFDLREVALDGRYFIEATINAERESMPATIIFDNGTFKTSKFYNQEEVIHTLLLLAEKATIYTKVYDDFTNIINEKIRYDNRRTN